MSIFITGDIHGSIDIDKISYRNWPGSKSLTRKDYLLICGDFGLPFFPSDTWDDNTFLPNKYARNARASYQYWIKWLSERPYTILWIDGNHDNHPFWYNQPTVEWSGGAVNIHPEANNVIHLKRGEYYTIDGKTFWTMGGAMSHDKEWRTEGYSWWPEEIPSVAEMEHGLQTLEQHENQVDYIITHTMPQSLISPILSVHYDNEPTRSYFDEVYRRIDFGAWFCGHFHVDIDKSNECGICVVYNDIVQLDE